MKYVRYSLIVVCSLCLWSCDDTFSGVLGLQQPITLNIKKAQLTIPAGKYQAEIDADSDGVKLELTVAGKKQSIEFAMPKGKKIKSFNDVNISPTDSGQPYVLKGDENTVSTDSDLVSTTESCTYTTTEQQCGWEKTPVECDKDGNCTGGDLGYVCNDVDVNHNGTEDVEYYTTDTETNRHVQVIDPNSQQSIGLFSNRTTESVKHYTHEGNCTGW